MNNQGELGTIYIGEKQVGGFLDWWINTTVLSDGMKIEAGAKSFWLDKRGTKYRVKFYKRMGNRLILLQDTNADIKFPEIFNLGKLTTKKIGITYVD